MFDPILFLVVWRRTLVESSTGPKRAAAVDYSASSSFGKGEILSHK
jgi:hypothetical protein